MEHLLASELEMRVDPAPVPAKARGQKIRELSRESGVITAEEERELERLALLRNPLTHLRGANDPRHIDQQAMRQRSSGDTIAITLAMKVLAKPAFRL